jgi:DNA mismatch endonuclease (patch repair protein)
MTDVFSKRKRSDIMSRARSSGNQNTELALIRILRRHGITGWRRNSSVFGKPDFVFQKQRVAVFVDGCFWHGCPIHGSIPASNRVYWTNKIGRNKVRDKLVSRILNSSGWRVLRLWEHALQKREEGRLLTRLNNSFTKTNPTLKHIVVRKIIRHLV